MNEMKRELRRGIQIIKHGDCFLEVIIGYSGADILLYFSSNIC